jgi:uncharacterized delta-60 repeat protein
MKIESGRRHSLFRWVGATYLMVAIAATAYAAPGDLDPMFGIGGRVLTEVTLPPQCVPYTASIVGQPDGRVLLGGGLAGGGGPDPSLCPSAPGFLVRYLSDGTLDGTFGVGGRVLYDNGEGGDLNFGARGRVTLQSDGKILVVGSERIMRLLPNGNFDPSFGQGNGTSEILFPYGLNAVAVQSDGKIVVAADLDSSWAIRRLNSDGSQDLSFGRNGVIAIPLWPRTFGWFFNLKLHITTDEKIVFVGEAAGNCMISKYDSGGTPDSTFGEQGRLLLPCALLDSLIQPDGSVVILGALFGVGSEPLGMSVVRYNSMGNRDLNFGSAGIVEIPSLRYWPGNITRMQDGRFVVTGISSYRTDDFAATRFFADGTLDRSFGSGGLAVHVMNSDLKANIVTGAAAVHIDGRVLIAGHFSTLGDLAKNVIVAGLMSGSESAVSGRVISPSGSGIRNVTVVVVDESGNRRSAITSSLGYYRVVGLSEGKQYTVTAVSKRYRFVSRTIVADSADLFDFDLVAEE